MSVVNVYYEVCITGPDCERTEIYYELPKAKASFDKLVSESSTAHTVDLRRIERELIASFDGECALFESASGLQPEA